MCYTLYDDRHIFHSFGSDERSARVQHLPTGTSLRLQPLSFFIIIIFLFLLLSPPNTSHALCALQIGANLKGVTRALRLYDYNRDGRIQRHELRRLLDNYFPMSDAEFKR